MRKILIAANENPFATAARPDSEISGLAAALKHSDKKLDVRVILPLYAGMEELSGRLSFAAQVRIEDIICAIYSCGYKNATYYFVDSECRSFSHEAERNAVFCKAVPEAMPALEFFPDILHAQDPQTALSVIHLKDKSKRDSRYAGVQCVFAIRSLSEPDEHGGNVNLIKSAVEFADAVVISAECKKELTALDFSDGLQAFLEKLRHKLFEFGEIDQEFENDGLFAKIAEEKARIKTELQRRLGLPEKTDISMIAMISRLTDRKKLDILTLAAEEILKEDVQFVVLGKGDAYIEKFFQNLSARFPQKAKAVISLDQTLANLIYAGADMCLLPYNSGICGTEYFFASKYGTVPLYGSDNSGYGFGFSPYSAWNFLSTIKQALALYRNKEAWNALLKKIILQDFMRKKTAEEYIKLYNSLSKDK